MMKATFHLQKYEVAVLDVIRGKLYKGSEHHPSLDALLKGEAATFIAIWNSIEEQEQKVA